MPLFLPEKFHWKVKWKIQKFKNEVILEGFKSQKWGEKIVKDCQISTLDFQCVIMSIDSCLKNLYFISSFVICTVKYTHTCALGTGFKHHFIHPSCHPSGHPSVSSWSVYFDKVEKEWNTDAVWQRIIYISVVVLFIYFFLNFLILGFLNLGTLILSLSQQLKELGGAFFFFLKFYLEYWKFSMFFTLP
jgi:hypothetical protein